MVFCRGCYILVPSERTEVPLRVVIDGRLVAEPSIGVISPVEKVRRKRIEIDGAIRYFGCRRGHRITPDFLYFVIVAQSTPASIRTSSVCWPCSGAPGGTTDCSSN